LLLSRGGECGDVRGEANVGQIAEQFVLRGFLAPHVEDSRYVRPAPEERFEFGLLYYFAA
jgi:hypothetical protein